VRAVYFLAKHYHKGPDQLSDEELKNYLFYLAQEKQLSASSLNQHVSGLRFFYHKVLQRPVDHLWRVLPRVHRAIRRPQVFSVAELERLFTVGCPHPKHRAFLMTVYGAGLRLNEACHLQLQHLDRGRMQIRVEQGKGRKDRYTLLSPKLLAELEQYWRCFRPVHWLFPASGDPRAPMVDRVGQKIFYQAVARSGVVRKGGIHSLRHHSERRIIPSGA
jgi:integrase